MTIACIADKVHAYSVTNCLNEQRKGGGQFCDVLLKVGGLTLPTHACVLSAVSPFFRDLIYDDRPSAPHLTSLPQQIDLVVPRSDELPEVVAGAELEVVAGLLDYIYTGKIVVKPDQLDLLLHLAETFMLDGLLSIARRYADNRKWPTTSGAPVTKTTKRGASKQVVTLAVRRGGRGLARTTAAPTPPSKTVPTVVRRPLRSTTTDAAVTRRRHCPTTLDRKESVARKTGTSCGKRRGDAGGGRVAAAVKGRLHKYWFSCTQCKFFSCDVKAVREHKLVHPGKSYVCNSCGYFTVQCAKLLEHMLLANHPDRECSICGIVCDDQTSFREHLLRRHDPRKPFICSMCDFKCTSRGYLAAHIRKHTTDRPYVCGVCKAAFKWKKSLQTHSLSHSKEKAYMCDQCDFRTAYKGTLKLHLRRHNGEMFKCPHEGCTCEAYSQQNLRKHMLTHNNEKPYVCEVCGQKYSQEQSLRRHLKVHEPGPGNRLHCRHCQFSTTRGYKLKEHARKVHHIDPPFGRSGVPFPAIAVESFGRVVCDTPSGRSTPPSIPSEAQPQPPPVSSPYYRQHCPDMPPDNLKDDEREEEEEDRPLHHENVSYIGSGLGLSLFGGYH